VLYRVTKGVPNDTIGYAYTVDLTGSSLGVTADPGGFTIVDTLPNGLSYVSSTGEDVTCAASGATVTCTFDGPIAIGDTRTVTLTTSVLAAAFPQVVNEVTVHSLYQDPAFTPVPGSDTAVVLEALAHTGVNTPVGLLIAFAILLLLLGAVLFLIGRKRRGTSRG